MKKQNEKRMRKKLFSIVGLLSIIALCGGTGIVAEAEELVTADGYQYQVLDNGTVDDTSDDTIEIVGYTGSETELVIPDTIEGMNVTSIGQRAFQSHNELTNITISSNITSIGEQAFSGSGLKSILIPKNVINLGRLPFYTCFNLTSITVEEENPVYDSREDCNAIIETESNTLIQGCDNTTIPSSVKIIGEYAFAWRKMSSITIPEGIEVIGEYAFWQCWDLTNIVIPSTTTSIMYEAFWGCTGLTSIVIPKGVTNIVYTAFHGCSQLKSIVVEEGNPVYDSRENCNAIIKTETDTLMQGCSTTKIPSDVKTIGDSAFLSCSGLTTITIPKAVAKIERWAFSGCGELKSIVVEEGNTMYDSRDNCNAIIETATNTLVRGCENTKIPSSVTTIGQLAFSGCSGLISITIPKGIIAIEDSAFSGCENLRRITIPEGVTTIGYSVFDGCRSLVSATVPTSVTSMKWSVFLNNNEDFVVYAEDGSYAFSWAIEQGHTVKKYQFI